MAWVLTDVTTGVDLSAAVDVQSLLVTQRAYAETSRLSAKIRDEAGTIAIATEHEILLADGAVKTFAGLVRVLRKADAGVSAQRIYEIECQDYTTLLADDYVPAGAGIRSASESDKARITWIFATFGTKGISIGASVVQLRATMPAAQDFSGLNLHECLTLVAGVTGGSFYVDYDKVLHYFNSETNAAPFGLSDNPNGSTTFGYEQFAEASDTVDFLNEVHVIGAPGVSTTRYLGGSAPAAGTKRATVLNDPEIPDVATAQARGDSLLTTYGVTKKPSSLVTYQPGLKAGQYVQVTHAGWSISAVSYRIAGLSARPDTKDRIAYAVDFGSGTVDLSSLASGQAGAISGATGMAAGAKSKVNSIADLSVGGANLVLNSSFEDGTSWVVGAQWAIGFTPSGGQLAFAGSDTARAALSAQTAGDLVTAKIPVNRNDEYAVSFWRYVRSRSSGTFRAFVKEYNAANTLLATTLVDVTAADADWTRTILRFAPAVSLVPAKIAWQTTTTKIEIGFNSAGASATLTVDVDGVQLERGQAPTAYAPAPGEILAGTITTTLIADDAVTSPKLIAGAVVAGKIAAGVVTATEIQAGAVTTSKLAAGAITLYDEYGQVALMPGGFGGAWVDFIAEGVYDSMFRLATAGTLVDGRTSALPNWTVQRTTLTSLTIVSDAAWPGGKYVEATPSALSGEVFLASDMVAIPQAPIVASIVCAAVVAGGSQPTAYTHIYFYDVNSTLISISTVQVSQFNVSQTTPLTYSSTPVWPPATAKFAKLGLTLKEQVAHSGSTKMRVGGGALRRSDTAGKQYYAFPRGAAANDAWDQVATMAAGHAFFIPIEITSPLEVQNLKYLGSDTSGARSMAWALYFDDGVSSTLREVPGVRGARSYTPTAKTVKATAVDVERLLDPGNYILAFENTHATQTLGLGYSLPGWIAAGYSNVIKLCYEYASFGALAATIDIGAATGVQAIMGVWLSGLDGNFIEWGG